MSTSPTDGPKDAVNVSVEHVRSLLDRLDRGIIVASREGQTLILNERAKKSLASIGVNFENPPNLFRELFHVDPDEIGRRIEKGDKDIALQSVLSGRSYRARLNWIPQSDWLAVEVEADAVSGSYATGQPTIQELLQEREITYRNLLAAYLKLQEVNRQKTVFLASAAHELKTPLAVIKGYYDLLLTGSLGRLTEKQKDILEESKESCERLLRLVSIFLNYSALESGKLVLQLRENDLRDCLAEIASRWHEAFVRKQVRLESLIPSDLPVFKFDYQKVQQTVANLLDNALKHTPAGGHVLLRAELHFLERRA